MTFVLTQEMENPRDVRVEGDGRTSTGMNEVQVVRWIRSGEGGRDVGVDP